MRELMMGVGLAFAVGCIGCSSASSPGSFGEDAGASGECSKDSDCKGSRICKSGACVDIPVDSGAPAKDTGTPPPDCAEPGETCTGTTCCQASTKAPKGAICASNDNVCHAKCASNSECVSGCCATVTGETYGACADKSFCPAGGIGDGCADASSCKSGLCAGGTDGWCTRTCTYSTDCYGDYATKNKYGHYNYCVKTTSGSNGCFPSCTTDADCSWYPGMHCASVTTTAGTSVRVCSS
jgi:hypothetical protein